MPTQAAFLELLNQHRAVVYKLSRLYARDPDEQHDLFQEMVLQALTAWSRFEARSQFST
jgi:RNA polymerase sigma-70 factor (ECF subfamily)